MIKNCKFCEKEIPIPYLGESFWCSYCQKYSMVFSNDLANGVVPESESLQVGNYFLHFFPEFKEASVVERLENGKFKLINSIKLNELTHELAVQWVKKLKTYVLFQ